MSRVRSETGITATPNPRSVMWWDDLPMPADPATFLVLPPTTLFNAYTTVEPPAPITLSVERIQPTRDVVVATGQMSTAKAVNEAHDDSGLTWEQLARVFGVSRRAVHMWATGGRMNATNAEILMRFVDYLDQMHGGPDERRTALLTIGRDGSSALDRFRMMYKNVDRRFDSLPRPESLLGALHGDVAE